LIEEAASLAAVNILACGEFLAASIAAASASSSSFFFYVSSANSSSLTSSSYVRYASASYSCFLYVAL